MSDARSKYAGIVNPPQQADIRRQFPAQRFPLRAVSGDQHLHFRQLGRRPHQNVYALFPRQTRDTADDEILRADAEHVCAPSSRSGPFQSG